MSAVPVTPAKAGVQGDRCGPWVWIPAFAGTTNEVRAA
jgi:hypothetical protein